MKNIVWETYEFEFQKNEEEQEVYDDDDLDTIDIPVLMQTPFGLFKVDDSMNPFKRFEFRMGHTNFDLTPTVIDKIQKVAGVEVLIVVTRYRFIIATAKLFDFRDVRVAIEKELCGKHQVLSLLDEIKNKDIKEHVVNIYNEIKNKKYWCIYVFPNGSIVHHEDDEKTDEYEQTEALYVYASQVSNGVLITSENEYK